MQRQTIKQRNQQIKNEFKEMLQPHLKKGYIYEQLAEKYWLNHNTIERIVTDQYNKAFYSEQEQQEDTFVFEITIKRK